MNPIFQNLRVGKVYRLVNHGEKTEFLILKKISENNFLAKNTLTLEKFEIQNLVQFGLGKDFGIRELDK